MTLLSRLGTAALVVTVLTIATALLLGIFPRTLLGVVLLVAVGMPVVVVGEFLADLAFHRAAQEWYVRAGALIGLAVLLGALWRWWITHSVFVHRNFLG